ncbi:hypothetical protein BGZ63DRAFT_374679 [Mariannaea sp. PMI_226]|nr:hypothetical protein BGZ63DRAFT_374679 [Mariannaea sp. PMI_226]
MDTHVVAVLWQLVLSISTQSPDSVHLPILMVDGRRRFANLWPLFFLSSIAHPLISALIWPKSSLELNGLRGQPSPSGL